MSVRVCVHTGAMQPIRASHTLKALTVEHNPSPHWAPSHSDGPPPLPDAGLDGTWVQQR